MLDNILNSSVSRRSILTVVSVWTVGAMTCMTLTACNDAAVHHPIALEAAAASPIAGGPSIFIAPMRAMDRSASATVPSAPPLSGSAALHEYREDVDQSHAAVASYSD